jgi:hypothetical protein
MSYSYCKRTKPNIMVYLLSMGMFGFDRVVCQVGACRGARGLVKTGNQELRKTLSLTLPKSLTSR